MKAILNMALAAVLTLSAASAVRAESAQAGAPAVAAMSSGEVKKIDKSTGKMTIKHGPLANIGMDAMTMVFSVKEPAMLDQVNPGDKIRFVAEEPNGQLTVMKLEKQH